MKKLALIFILGGFAFLAPSVTPSQQACAQVAPQPCDPNFFEQMKSRAWLEAEREIMQNQNLIFKADSVLEYTCFDRFANLAAWPTGDIFSHSAYFGEPIIEREDLNYALQHSIQNIVMNAVVSFRIENFDHNLLGGRGDVLDMIDREWDPVTTPYLPYQCTVMNEVWQTSKCLNFVHNADLMYDGFMPLDTLECAEGTDCEPVDGYDVADIRTLVRQFPEPCGPGTGMHAWGDQIELAENEGQILYLYQEPLALIFEDVADGVCSNPGCTYANGGCS